MRKASKKARRSVGSVLPPNATATSPTTTDADEEEESQIQEPGPGGEIGDGDGEGNEVKEEENDAEEEEGDEDDAEEEEEEEDENEGNDENLEIANVGEDEEVQVDETVEEPTRVDKPQIWVRIQSTSMDGMYEVDGDKKTLKLMIKPEDKVFRKKSGDTMCFSFETEGVLQGVSQEDVYETVAQELADNALQGVSGIVVCVGPEQSGKSFSLFGRNDSFQDRGIVQRALEDVFAKLQNSPKGEYHIILSMFEVRKDKIRDLITLSSAELTRVGNFGPKGLYYEEAISIDHALGLVLRGLAGQKLLPCEARPAEAKFHTLVYVDILAHVKNESWRSRITFAKIASVPSKIENLSNSSKRASSCRPYDGRKDNCYATDGLPRKCCGGPQGPMAELINIRKDMYFLEQMFTKFYDVQKMNEYYHELEKLGMYMAMKPPNQSSNQYFRQSKLAHCLKDIISENALVRLILHVRPERAFLQSTLEIMRFAERVRYLPGTKTRIDGGASDIDRCAEVGVNTNAAGRNPQDKIHQDKLKDAFKTATAQFEERLAALEGSCKDEIKPAFDAFKETWEDMLEKEFSEVSPEQEGDSTVVVVNDNEEEEEEEASEGPSEMDLQSVDSKQSLAPTDDSLNSEKVGSKKSRNKLKGGSGDNSSNSSGKKKDRSKQSKAQLGESSSEAEEQRSTSAMVSSDSIGGALKEMSISVIPVGTAEPLDGNNSLAENLHFKCKCWQTFAKTEAGKPLVAELGEKAKLLKQYMAEHNDTLQEVVSGLSKLVAIELNLNELEPDRRFSDENDQMSLLTTKEQRMETVAQAKEQLKNFQEQQGQIRSLTNEMDSVKQECDKAFDEFCEEGSNEMEMQTKQRAPVDKELELRYGEINRIAKEEAQILIRKAYPTKPPWTTFY